MCSLAGHAQDRPAAPAIHGFARARLDAQRDLERRFDAQLSTANLTAWLERLAGRPHHTGSPHGKANAEFMAGLLREWGYQVEIAQYDVLFPTPTTRVVELVAPTKFTASLTEPQVAGDAVSKLAAEALPTFNMYSADGDVTGDLVYVNYGVPADYEELARRGIDVKGKIVIARYGGSWRGIKPKVAAEHGAIGCLIYSDPRDDGYGQGDVYPKGGWRSEHSAQRGSVADMPVYPGDPLTPGVAATKDAKRPEFTKAADAHEDSRPAHLVRRRPAAAAGARRPGGASGLARRPARHLPPRARAGARAPEARVRLEARTGLRRDRDPRLARSSPTSGSCAAITTTPGWPAPATRRAAWSPCSRRPARSAQLARAGWKPRRTLVFAAWDAEEPGLLGSTEWVEDHAEALSAKVVAYINSDSNARGFFSAGGSHSLERFVNEIARDVPDPKVDGSVGRPPACAHHPRRVAQVARRAGPRREALRDQRARLGLRLHALPAASRHRVAQHRLRR